MVHKHRYMVVDEPDIDVLIARLSEHTWCGCSGFRWNGLLLLNDAFSPDGAQEYAIVRESDMAQIESFTISWMTREEIKTSLLLMTEPDTGHEVYAHVTNKIETPEEHGTCSRCA